MRGVDGRVLRRATADDADAIQAVLAADPVRWEAIEGAPLRPDEAAHLLAERPPGVPPERKHVYVADEACVIDLVEGFPEPATWYLGLIFVTPAARGRGLGTRVLEAMFDHVRAAGGLAVRLAVVTSNAGARRLYERLGFAHVATRQRPTQLGALQEVEVLERRLE